MHSLGRTLLLLLMLPGLLVPAGFGLQRCCCTGAVRITDARSGPQPCPEFARAMAPWSGACCESSTPDRSEGGVATGARAPGGCDCSLQRAPEWKPEPYVPGAGPGLPVLAAAEAAFTVLPVVAASPLPLTTAARPPPPPGAQRNLPLRL